MIRRTSLLFGPTGADTRHWTVRYRAHYVLVAQPEPLQHWVLASDVRLCVPGLPPDATLKRLLPGAVARMDDTQRLFIHADALHRELSRSTTRETLLFAQWLEREVLGPLRNARARAQTGYPDAARPGHAEPSSSTAPSGSPPGPPVAPLPLMGASDADVITALASPPPPGGPANAPAPSAVSMGTLPHQARFERPDQVGAITPPASELWHRERGEQARPRSSLAYAREFWRGRLSRRRTFLSGLALSAGLPFLAILTVYLAHFEDGFLVAAWAAALFTLLAAGANFVWIVASCRVGVRAWLNGANLWTSAAAVVLGCSVAMYSTQFTLVSVRVIADGLWLHYVDGLKPVRVTPDRTLGRILVEGDIGIGSSRALREALDANPGIRLLQLDSPGGYVLEGNRMSELILQRRLDTVVFDDCASACTLLFVSGTQRFLGPRATLGFHRSYRVWGVDDGWTETEHQMARFFRSRGLADGFIQRALDTPGYLIWEPSQPELFTAGAATLRWSERPAAYN